MRYVTLATNEALDRLTTSIHALCEKNADALVLEDLPACEADAWAGEQEEDDNESLTTEPELVHLNEEDDLI